MCHAIHKLIQGGGSIRAQPPCVSKIYATQEIFWPKRVLSPSGKKICTLVVCLFSIITVQLLNNSCSSD